VYITVEEPELDAIVRSKRTASELNCGSVEACAAGIKFGYSTDTSRADIAATINLYFALLI
jgi:hypothetical protein